MVWFQICCVMANSLDWRWDFEQEVKIQIHFKLTKGLSSCALIFIVFIPFARFLL